MERAAIRTEALTKYYGKNRGIIDVTLRVEEGDFFGFIGPNGAGKSTTIRTLLGLIFATSGKAEVFGKDIVRDKISILADTGYLPGEASFYNNMKVGDMISYASRLRGVDCRAEAETLCRRLELDTSRKIGELSLGNRKKLGIVIALQHRPKLYILDEPTSGLDPLMQQEFFSIMEERNREGATVFLSSHILGEVSRYCRHAAVIREGRLTVCDSVENLAHTGVKYVTLQGVDRTPSFENISDLAQEGNLTRFLYRGDANTLIKELSGYTFSDVAVRDPDLDEVFRHFYEGEEK